MGWSEPLSLQYFGLAPYDEIRRLQEALVAQRIANLIPDTILIGEHPPILTIGQRAKPGEIGLSAAEWKLRGVTVREVDRGGGVTLHLPGQLVFYPVISLRQRKLGVRRFVESVFSAMQRTAARYGRSLNLTLQPPGLYLDAHGGVPGQALCGAGDKVGFAGLRIRDLVSDHGFSLNLRCDTTLFKLFAPCGDSKMSVGALELSTEVDTFGAAVTRDLIEVWRAPLGPAGGPSLDFRGDLCMREGTKRV